VHHHTIQINQPARCNNFSSLLLDIYLQLNMFRASSRPSSGAQQLRGDSSVVGCGWAGWPDHDQQHCYHHTPKVKPEAATAVVALLMMGGRTPETCWAVNKHQVMNLRNCCIWLLIYLNSLMLILITFSLTWNFVVYYLSTLFALVVSFSTSTSLKTNSI
jgi:hypothetical protein